LYNTNESDDNDTYEYNNTDYEVTAFDRFKTYNEKEFKTLLTNSTTASELSEKILERTADIYPTITRKTKTQNIDLEIMDFVVANHERYSEDSDKRLYEIIGITKSMFPTAEVTLVMREVRDYSEEDIDMVTGWLTGTAYTVGEMVHEEDNVFLCVSNHTSGTFTTDWLTNSYWHPLGDAPGMIKAWGNTSAPPGWVACDGTAISRTTYSLCFAAISTTWGVGDGSTTFNVPDLRGVFVRGSGTHGSLTMADTNAYAGPSVGSSENDQYQDHAHRQEHAGAGSGGPSRPTMNSVDVDSGDTQDDWSVSSLATGGGESLSWNGYGTPRKGDETRPVNYGILYIIKV
jgi:microcystin-dependent protein